MMELTDTKLEWAVVAATCAYPDQVPDVREMLDEGCFEDAYTRAVWNAIVALDEDHKDINQHTVRAQAAMECPELTFTMLATADMYGGTSRTCWERLRELRLRRMVYNLGRAMETAARNEGEDMDATVDRMRMALGMMDGAPGLTKLATLLDRLRDRLDGKKPTDGERMARDTEVGIRMLDTFGGLRSGQLVIIGGATGHGKTSLALTMALHAIEKEATVAYYSLEMDGEELAARLVAMKSNVTANQVLHRNVNATERPFVDSAIESLRARLLLFDDRATSNIDNIIASIRSAARRDAIHGAVIDYLQILNVNARGDDGQEQVMATASRRLKNLAKDLGIWIVALSQVNRDPQRPDPDINRLRGSGQIAEAADIVLLVYRPEVLGKAHTGRYTGVDPTGTAVVTVAKGRNIGTGSEVMAFDARRTLFTDLDQEHLPGMPKDGRKDDGQEPPPPPPEPLPSDTQYGIDFAF